MEISRKFGAIAAMVGFVGGLAAVKTYENHMEKEVPQARPPRFEDVNGDGIEDKIVEQRVYADEFYWTVPEIQQTVLYGVGEINGKRRYLPKEVFEEWNKE